METEEKSEKPKTIDEYTKWLKDHLSIEIDGRHKRQYESGTDLMSNKFKESELWSQILLNIKEFNETYQIEHDGYSLYPYIPKLEILTKSYNSLYEKTFRKNILENSNWVKEPKGGWITPDNWFSRIDDILRTRFVVKYLDGVEFLLSRFSELCDDLKLTHNEELKAKEEGYYAAHLYVVNEFEIPDLEYGSKKAEVTIELQITTHLQEVIETLTHKYYEKRRKIMKDENFKWQWDYNSEEFAANYLAHILHYVEGMIMEIRSKQTGET